MINTGSEVILFGKNAAGTAQESFTEPCRKRTDDDEQVSLVIRNKVTFDICLFLFRHYNISIRTYRSSYSS